jgi:hypothetical protein
VELAALSIVVFTLDGGSKLDKGAVSPSPSKPSMLGSGKISQKRNKICSTAASYYCFDCADSLSISHSKAGNYRQCPFVRIAGI